MGVCRTEHTTLPALPGSGVRGGGGGFSEGLALALWPSSITARPRDVTTSARPPTLAMGAYGGITTGGYKG